MSRSYRRTPKRHYDMCKSEKEWRVVCHHQMRVAVRQCISRASINGYDNLLLPHAREMFNDFDFGRARRIWFDPKERPKLMRK